jgi:hypothetical protein
MSKWAPGSTKSHIIYTGGSFSGDKAAVASDNLTTNHKRNEEVLQDPMTEPFMCTKDLLSLRPLDARLAMM